MTRIVTVGAAQLGPIQRSDSRASVVKRMLELLRRAAGHKCNLVVFPELALTTFFPRWWMTDQDEIDSFFEREMPGNETAPLFNKAQYALANTWIKPYINVPQGQMKPFTTGIFNQSVVPEPAASTQSVYHSLDAAVESVLTDKNADIDALLKAANTQVQAILDKP